MIINNYTYPVISPQFKGKRCEENIQQEAENASHKSHLLPKLCLATAGFFVGGLYTTEQIYNMFNFSPGVESEQTSFKTHKDAYEYAQGKIVNELNKEYPKEYLVLIGSDNDILGEFRGDSESVYGELQFFDMLKTKIPGYSYTSMHGHPEHDGYSTPLSFNDYEILNNNPSINEIVAFNKNGEHSTLRKKDNFTPIEPDQLYELAKDLWATLVDEGKESMPDNWEKVGQEIKENDGVCEYKYTYSEEQFVQEYQKSLDGIKCIDKFWRENAPKMGLEYETNYSYLQ